EWDNTFEDKIRWDIGDEKCTLFRKDKWLEMVELKVRFPKLFSLSLSKTVNRSGGWVNNRWTWKMGWRMNLFVWEENQVAHLLCLLDNKFVVRDVEDMWIWGKMILGFI
ncbi:hypothetical protein PHAVU_005G130200, partial [Phaseolus vulgaris]